MSVRPAILVTGYGTGMRTLVTLIAAIVLATAACTDEPLGGDEGANVSGFRILEGIAERFEWREGDNPAADTLALKAGQNMTVRFIWLDAVGETVEVPSAAELQVAISNGGAAAWEPDASGSFRGTFDPGPFEIIETAMRITLIVDADTLFASPLLQLHVSP